MYSIDEKVSSKFLKLPIEIIKLISNRGIVEDDEVLDYLLKEYKLENPFNLTDMDKAVYLIGKYIKEGKKIIICGDYDADGILGSTALFLFLDKLNANVEINFPQREDGHGISLSRVKKLKDIDCDLIISVDNGITSFEGVKFCKDNRIPVIITDHHELGETLPDAYAIVNPKRDESKSLKSLCGAGVAFYLIRALKSYLNSSESIVDYLVLASLGTVADMVELKGDNRVLVDQGINLLFETNLVGFNYLLDEIKFFKYPNATDVAFKITPIINSAGRLNLSETLVSLLKDTSMNSYSLVKEVLNINEIRKQISDQGVVVARENLVEKDSIVFSKGDISLGFTGLIANKFLDEFKKTAIIVAGTKGSIRTKNSNAKKMIDSIPYIEGGGHQGAAGFHFDESTDINKLISDLNDKNKEFEIKEKSELYEIEMTMEKIDELKKYFNLMEPFGMSNPAPMIKTKVMYDSYKVYKKEHLIINYKKFKFQLFFARDIIPSVVKKLKEGNLFIVGEITYDLENISILINNVLD